MSVKHENEMLIIIIALTCFTVGVIAASVAWYVAVANIKLFQLLGL